MGDPIYEVLRPGDVYILTRDMETGNLEVAENHDGMLVLRTVEMSADEPANGVSADDRTEIKDGCSTTFVLADGTRLLAEREGCMVRLYEVEDDAPLAKKCAKEMKGAKA